MEYYAKSEVFTQDVDNSENVVIEMRGITKRFGSLVANDGINLQLKKGEIHALLGENGAGKSTLVRTLNRLFLSISRGTMSSDTCAYSGSGSSK